MTGRDEADRLLEVITVDCYNASEQMTAFYEVFAEEVPLPPPPPWSAPPFGSSESTSPSMARSSQPAASARRSFRICDFRTWCSLPMPQPPGFTRRTAAVSA